jgi:hypothetical protein
VDYGVPNCTPGQASTCLPDGITLEYCDGAGFLAQYTCNGSCSIDRCDVPVGQACADPLIATAGSTRNGNFTGTPTLDPGGGRVGSCFFGEFSSARGNDTFYQIDLNAGDLLRADLTTTNSQAYLYIMENCHLSSSCIASNYQRGSASEYYFADQSGPVFVVVDSSSTFSSSTIYSVDFTVTQGSVCAPDSAVCSGPDTVALCDSQGNGVAQNFVCSSQCISGACAPDPPVTDLCMSAADVGSGTLVYGNWTEYSDDVKVRNPTCSPNPTDSSDVVHMVTLQAGEVLHAKLESFGNEVVALYLISDCNDPTASCVAGGAPLSQSLLSAGSQSPNTSSELFYAPQSAETVYVVADSGEAADGLFGLLIEKVPQSCTPGTQICMADGVTLETCNSYGLPSYLGCQGTCSIDRCDVPSGDACVDAIPLTSTGSYTSSFDKFTSLTDPGSGTCILYASQSLSGTDAVFAVDLNQGEILDAELTTTTWGSRLYVLDDCLKSPRDACAYAGPSSSNGFAISGGAKLSFFAEQTQTYYIVVDTEYPQTDTFTLNLSQRVGMCQPGGTTCEAGTAQVSLCNEVGSSFDATGTCSSSCLTSKFCTPPVQAPDLCADAHPITSSTVIVDS